MSTCIDNKSNYRRQILMFMGLSLLIGVVYSFGLSGTFHLDDYATLPTLEQWGGINSWDQLKQFVSAGFTGPTGRPVSLLTFALQSSCWPDDPGCFLLFNIVIHLINAALVFVLLHVLFRELDVNRNLKQWLPLVVSVLWAAHPMQVSSVLYIIQRMVLLAAFFDLLCLISYLTARRYAFDNKFQKASIWLLISFFMAVLAVFSKENTVLIPLQLLLLESLFKWSGKNNGFMMKSNPYIKVVFIAGVLLPSLVVCFYLFEKLGKHTLHYWSTGEEYATRRPYTFFERLFTQFRVLGDYLSAIVFPRIQDAGVFFDAYPLSKSFFQPLSTTIWFSLHILVLGLAWVFRKKWPIVVFGVLWFYINHLIESSVITIEPKFEHRNYLPMLGVITAIAVGILSSRLSNFLKATSTIAVLVIFMIVLAWRTSLWGNPKQAVMVWVHNNPDSIRSLEAAALVYSKDGTAFEEVMFLLKRAVEVSGDDPVMVLKFKLYACEHDKSISLEAEKYSDKLQESNINWQLTAIFEEILNKKISGVCSQFSLDEYQALARAIKSNVKYKKTSIPKKMADFIARSELVFGDKKKAVDLYKSINYESTRLDFIMTQALWIASYGELEAAIDHLDKGITMSTGKNEFILEQAKDMLQRMIEDRISNE